MIFGRPWFTRASFANKLCPCDVLFVTTLRNYHLPCTIFDSLWLYESREHPEWSWSINIGGQSCVIFEKKSCLHLLQGNHTRLWIHTRVWPQPAYRISFFIPNLQVKRKNCTQERFIHRHEPIPSNRMLYFKCNVHCQTNTLWRQSAHGRVSNGSGAWEPSVIPKLVNEQN